MTTCTFHAARLGGVASVPPAKSEAHRAILLAAFGSGACRLHGFPPPLCDDNFAMINGVTALGAKVEPIENDLLITPCEDYAPVDDVIECDVHACAAALRMLIPAFLVRGQNVRFVMDDGLFKRPLTAFEPLIRKLGATMTLTPSHDGRRATVELRGRMPAGDYEIDGSLSSQFASGLLIALPHALNASGQPSASTLHILPPIVSRPYLDMTLGLMKTFGAQYTEREDGLFELSARTARNPVEATVSPDWSQAAVLLCASALGSGVILSGMRAPRKNERVMQGDSRVAALLGQMGLLVRNLKDGLFLRSPSHAELLPLDIDCTDIPDVAPILALTCTQACGVSTLRGVNRLRVKECDRLSATEALLTKLGAQVEIGADDDTLVIHGPTALHGGFEADARGDHRMVMLLATAALLCAEPITVHGVDALNKSWPGFLDTYQKLGGQIS